MTAAVVLLVVGTRLLQIYEPLRLTAMLPLVALVAAPNYIIPRRPSWIDFAMGIVWIFGVVQLFTSVNILPTAVMLGMQTIAIMVYALCRRGGHRMLAGGVAVVGTIVALLVIGAFILFRREILSAGFDNIYDFRFLFQPMRLHCNFIASTMMLGAGITLMALPRHCQWFRITAAALMWTAAALTFSRGALIAMVLMWVGLIVVVRPLKLKLVVSGTLLAVMLTVSAWCPREIAIALSMISTQSQQLSAQSRVDAATASFKAFHKRPVLGYGLGNYVMAVDCFTPDDTSAAYSSIPLSWLSEITVEQGVVGLLLFGGLTVAVTTAVWRRRHCRDALIGGVALAALAVKEMTQCSLWSASGTMFMAVIVIALIQSPALYGAVVRCRQGCFFVGLCAVAVGVTSVVSTGFAITHSRGVAGLCRGLDIMERYRNSGDCALLDSACTAFRVAAETMPCDHIPGNMLAEALWLRDGNAVPLFVATARSSRNHSLQLLSGIASLHLGDTTRAVAHLSAAIRIMPRLMLTSGIDSLLHTPTFGVRLREVLVSDVPSDVALASEKARYGFILYHLGRKSEAEKYLHEAVADMPSLATPWYLLGNIATEKSDSITAASYQKRFEIISLGAFRFGTHRKIFHPYVAKEHELLWMHERSRIASRYGF